MRFLCLHGRAACANTFEMQTARIRENLAEHEFVFLGGDVSIHQRNSTTGADEECGYGFLGPVTDVTQYQELLNGMVQMVERQGPFDGLWGFSEGGIVAATLLLEDARRPFAHFKCGIFFGAAPPLDPDDLHIGIVRCLNPKKDEVSLHIPTAHIYSHENSLTGTDGGSKVQSPLAELWADAGWSKPEQVHSSLAQLCGECHVYVHDQGHLVPGSRDVQALKGTLRAIDRTIKSAEC